MADEELRARPKLTREVLTAAALRIADAEGLEALSMRRLGAELGVDPMAAYRHLPNKKALLAGVVEAVLAGADVETDPAAPWQEQFKGVARAYRRAMLAHSPTVARSHGDDAAELTGVAAHRRARRRHPRRGRRAARRGGERDPGRGPALLRSRPARGVLARTRRLGRGDLPVSVLCCRIPSCRC